MIVTINSRCWFFNNITFYLIRIILFLRLFFRDFFSRLKWIISRALTGIIHEKLNRRGTMVGSARPPQRVKLLSTVARNDSTKESDEEIQEWSRLPVRILRTCFNQSTLSYKKKRKTQRCKINGCPWWQNVSLKALSNNIIEIVNMTEPATINLSILSSSSSTFLCISVRELCHASPFKEEYISSVWCKRLQSFY